MWSRSRVVLGAIAVTGLILSGCSAAADGSAQPVPSGQLPSSTEQNTEPSVSQGEDSSGSSGGDLPKNGAPAVEDPLDASMLQGDLCSAITNKQAQQFPGEFVGSKIKNSECVWTYDKDPFHLGFINGTLQSGNSQGLSKYYGGSFDEEIAKVKPVDSVKGYPAIHFDLGKSDSGVCVLMTGLRNELIYTTQVVLEPEHPSYDSPCEFAREFSGVVVDNLKEAQ